MKDKTLVCDMDQKTACHPTELDTAVGGETRVLRGNKPQRHTPDPAVFWEASGACLRAGDRASALEYLNEMERILGTLHLSEVI